MGKGVVKDFKNLVTKKRISNNLHEELSQKFDKIIEKIYPNLPEYEEVKVRKLKAKYDAGDTSVIKEYEMIMLGKSFEMLKDFYIRYNITTYDFEDALSDMYLINHKTAVEAFKKYSTSWFNLYYIKYYYTAIERHIWLLFSKQGINNVDIAQSYIQNELKSIDDMELEYEDQNPDDVVIFEDFQRCLNEAISTLSPREQVVIKKYFGLDDDNDRNTNEIGAEYNLSRERIRQILSKAIRKMRHPYRLSHFKDFAETSTLTD